MSKAAHIASPSERADRSDAVARQAKSEILIGDPGAAAELEADRIASQVTSRHSDRLANGAPLRAQHRGDSGSAHTRVAPRSVAETIARPGTALDPAVRRDMESRIGHDFSRVRVHSDPLATRSADAVDASAYTVGNHVVFGDAQFNPASASGRRLLAHELTHVAQHGLQRAMRGSIGPRTLRRQPKGRARRTMAIYKCTGVTLAGRTLTFHGDAADATVTAKPIDIPEGTYQVKRGGEPLTLAIVSSSTNTNWGPNQTKVLGFSWKLQGDQQAIDEFGERVNGYVESLTSPVPMRVTGTKARNPGKFKVIDESEDATGGGGAGDTDSGTGQPPTPGPEGGQGGDGTPGGTGTGTKGSEKTGGDSSGQQGGGKTDKAYAEKLKALLDGKDDKQLDADSALELRALLDRMTLDDIARFKAFSIKHPGNDSQGLIRSLRLFTDTKEIYEKQPLPSKPAEISNEAEKVLADAMKKFDPAKMTREEKEALARATVSAMSNAQLKNMTAAQIAESIVRVDKAAFSSGQDMSEGMNDAIKGTGWERAAGVARGVKGAAGFWGMLCFAAIVFSAFIPGLNLFVLGAHAMIAGMVAYAAATLQSEAEIKAAGAAKSPDDFQQKILRGTEARTQAITMAVAMALPIAAKLIGKIPLPLGLKNVSTALKAAKGQLKSKGTAAFTKAKATALDALAKAKTDLQPYSIQFRQTVAAIVQRLRKIKGTDLVAEIKNTPELQGLFAPEDIKALEGLSAPELELAKKGMIETLDNAPQTATETVGHIDKEVRAVEAKVAAATNAQQLDEALGQAGKLEDSNKIVVEAGTEARVKVAQARFKRLSELSLSEVKETVDDLLRDAQDVPNTHPHKAAVTKELRDLRKQVADLEKQQGKVDITRQLEDIDQRCGELDDLIADSVVKAQEARKPAPVAPPQKDEPTGTAQIAQEAGRLQERVVTNITGWPKNNKAFKTKYGNRIPDYLIKSDPKSKTGWSTAATPEEAHFLADSKYYDQTTIVLDDQIKGFIELAQKTSPPREKVLIFVTNESATIHPKVFEWAKGKVKVMQVKQHRSR